MGLIFIEAPAGSVATVQEVAQVFALTPSDLTTDRTAIIERSIAAVTAWLAGPDGWLGRSLQTQMLELRLDSPPTYADNTIALPRPPFGELVSVAYTGPDGNDHVADIADFRVTVAGDGIARLGPKLGRYWPAVPMDRDVIRIRYRAGYGPDAADLDPGLRHAIITAAARDFEARTNGLVIDLSEAAGLFATYRVWGPC